MRPSSRSLRTLLAALTALATSASGCNAVLGMDEKSVDDARICSNDGARCAPASGCSDGIRDGFKDLQAHPTIAGCLATWPKGSVLTPQTGAACGNGRGECAVPADACAPGWHVCGLEGPEEIRNRLAAAVCLGETGSFITAVGATTCGPCESQPIACCGKSCVAQPGGNCIYPGQTATMGTVNGFVNVCSSTESGSDRLFGVLCCFSP